MVQQSAKILASEEKASNSSFRSRSVVFFHSIWLQVNCEICRRDKLVLDGYIYVGQNGQKVEKNTFIMGQNETERRQWTGLQILFEFYVRQAKNTHCWCPSTSEREYAEKQTKRQFKSHSLPVVRHARSVAKYAVCS